MRRFNSTDHLAKAHNAWAKAPYWVTALAEYANQHGLRGTATKIGVSSGTISQVLSNSYNADTSNISAKVRLQLDLDSVDCPVLDEIKATRCVAYQKQMPSTASALHTKLSKNCPKCTHRDERLGRKED